METILHPPRTGMEVFRLLPEGTPCQLINDNIVMSPAPLLNHQTLCRNIFRAIDRKVVANGLGETFFSPVDVYLNNKNVFQPDIVFVASNRTGILQENGIYGAPDLVIEILSKGTRAYDRGAKKEVYEKEGVKEYWLVEPQTKVCKGFVLQEGKFQALEPTTGHLHIQLLDMAFRF
jgi:Uma2 family endonuclease